MYTNVSVAKPGKNAGTGGNKKDKITIFDWDEVLTPPARDSKGVVINDNIIMKPGCYMITVYGTLHTIDNGYKEEGDPDKEGYMQSVKFEHPGDSTAILEFDTNWQSRNVGIITEKCSSNVKKLYGSPCAPLHKIAEATDNKDSNHTMFTFTSTQRGPIIGIYNGTMTYDTVKGTAVAGATEVNVAAGEGQYQLTSGVAEAATVGFLTNTTDGGIYTLLGSGGAYPSTVESGGNVLLKNGTAWTALAGSSLTLKAFKSDVNTTMYIEVSRN